MSEEIRKELNALKGSVDTFLGSQKTWNEKHDARSREVLDDLKKNIDSLFELNRKLAANYGNLKCDEHKARIELIPQLVKEQVKGVERVVQWLWVPIVGAGAIWLIKNIFSLLTKMG